MYHASKALSLTQARDYYQKEYSRGDYYEHDTLERKGEWTGQGAKRLQLEGEVSREDFQAVLEGKSRAGGEQLVAFEAATDKHRAGWDFTCSADKSVSLVALVGGDERVREAHRLAVDRSLSELERYVQTKDRSRERVTTGEMVAAKFEHESSRKLDPQLHTHVVVMNMTRRGDGQWRALEPREMFAAQKLVTATYRAEMARELIRLGYEVEVRPDGSVGIAGFTRKQLDHFSQRRAQIENYLAKRSVVGAAHAERAARTTRRAKARDIDRSEVVAAWRARARDQGLDFASIRARAVRDPERFGRLVGAAPEEAARSLSHAIEHVSERRAVFHGRERDTEALVHGMGKVTLDEVRAAAASERSLIEIRDDQAPSGRFTTWETLRLEERNVALVRAGQGMGEPVMSELPAPASSSRALSADQERVASHILTSRDQVLGVMGRAGSGKTTTLERVREAAEGAGWRVRGFAPTTGAVKLLHEARIESVTVAALEKEKGAALVARRELWIVDEAGMLSTRQAAVLLERAREQGAKVVLVGDLRQHAAVEAGRPLRYLSEAGLPVAHLNEIRRQTGEDLRQVVKAASEGKAREAVARLEGAGRVFEVKDALDRHRAIAEEAARGWEKRTLVVAPSNEERLQLNRLIRERLIAEGRVERDSLKVAVAIDKGLSKPELRLARNYETGDRVRFTRGSKPLGLEPRAEGRVTGSDVRTNRVSVELTEGRRIEYDPRRVKGASVAKVEERRFAVGDRVQFRAPEREQRIANGQLGTVSELDPGRGRASVELDGGGRVELDLSRPLSLEHGYASTSHAAQGQSVERVIVAIDTEAPAALVNQQQFYVSISRAREEALVFTDSRADLARAVSRQAEKASALDYVKSEETSHGTRPEPGGERQGFRAGGRGLGEPAQPEARAAEQGAGRGAGRSPRDPAPAAGRDPDAGRADRRSGEERGVAAGPDRERAAPAGRGAGAGDGSALRERGAALGGDGGALPGPGGRAVAAEQGRAFGAGLHRTAEGGGGRPAAGRDGGGGGHGIRGLSPEGGARDPGPFLKAGRHQGAAGDLGEQAGALSPLARLKIRDEEYRALQGVLPGELFRKAVSLNVASREAGGERILTAAVVKQLGTEGIAKVAAVRDPRLAAVAIARELATRVIARARQEGAERER